MKKKKLSTREEYRGDFLDLYRKIVETVELGDIKDFDGLKAQKRIDFLKFCDMVATNDFFPVIIKSMLWETIQKSAMQSQDMDQLMVNRATANGVQLVQDFFIKYSTVFQDEFGGNKEQATPGRAFEPVEL